MFDLLDNTTTARVATLADAIDEELDALEAATPDAWTLEMLEALDPARLTDAQRVRALVLSQRVVAHTNAVGLRFAAAVDSQEGPDDWAQDEIACALGVGSLTGGRLLTTARALTGRLRHTAALLHAGLITYRKAEVLAERTAMLDHRAAAEVEAAVLPAAGEQTPFAFTNAVKAAVIAADPDDASARCGEPAGQPRRVWADPTRPRSRARRQRHVAGLDRRRDDGAPHRARHLVLPAGPGHQRLRRRP